MRRLADFLTLRRVWVIGLLAAGAASGGLVLDQTLALGIKGDGEVLLAAVIGLLGAATLVVSLAISLIQSATGQWPAYLYAEIRDDPERNRIIYLLLAGIVFSLTAFAGSMAGVGSGVADGAASAAIGAIALILLSGHILSRIELFDPLALVRVKTRSMARLRGRTRLTGRTVSNRRTAQTDLLRSLDQALGMGRWLAERDRVQDAVRALDLPIEELRAYGSWRKHQPSTRFGGYWDRRVERETLTQSHLPVSKEPYFQWSTPSETPTHPLWLEVAAGIWLSRQATSLVSIENQIIRAPLANWLTYEVECLQALARFPDQIAVQADAEQLIQGLLRPLRVDLVQSRRNRDAVFFACGDFLEWLFAQVGSEADPAGIARGWDAPFDEARLRWWLAVFARELASALRRAHRSGSTLESLDQAADLVATRVLWARTYQVARRAGSPVASQIAAALAAPSSLSGAGQESEWDRLDLLNDQTLLGRAHLATALDGLAYAAQQPDLSGILLLPYLQVLEWIGTMPAWKLDKRHPREGAILRDDLAARVARASALAG